MRITILKDLLVACGEGHRLFEEFVPVNLWRAHDTREGGHPMDFVEKEYIRSDGKPRPADIDVKWIGGEPWVFVRNRPRGVSTFDRPRAFKGRHWNYFLIPGGIELPKGLVIVKDNFNEAYGATHYTIAPEKDMPMKRFKKLLRDLFVKMRLETA